MTTYSFADVMCSINGPSGNFPIAGGPLGNVAMGSGQGAAEEGITIEMTEDKDTMTLGADGTLMHSLHVAIGGRITIRLLKTAPTNMNLSQMYVAQQASARLWGTNTITIDDMARGDKIQGVQMAFMKFPNIVYAKDGNVMEWIFGGLIVQTLGSGVVVIGTPAAPTGFA